MRQNKLEVLVSVLTIVLNISAMLGAVANRLILPHHLTAGGFTIGAYRDHDARDSYRRQR